MAIEDLGGKDPTIYSQSLRSPVVETDMGKLKEKPAKTIEVKPVVKKDESFTPQPTPTPPGLKVVS